MVGIVPRTYILLYCLTAGRTQSDFCDLFVVHAPHPSIHAAAAATTTRV